MSRRKKNISIGIILTVLGLIPAYYVFLDVPELVYDKDVVGIPLPQDLTGKMPNFLALVTVQNIGRRPSVDVRGTISVNGEILYYQVEGPGLPFADVKYSQLTKSEIMFSCPRLVQGNYPIKFSIWFKGLPEQVTVGVADAAGAAFFLKPIESTAEHAWKDFKFILVFLGVMGSVVGIIVVVEFISKLLRLVRAQKSNGHEKESSQASHSR